MIDPSAFNLTVDTKLPPNKITSILNMLRQGVNKQYYATFSSKQQDFFQYFVWEVLHGLWANHQSSTVRIAASTTVGQILMKLAPYFADQFLSSLTDAIEKTTSDSFLYLASFCYLAKFTSIEKLSNILNNKPILHLFGPNNSEHLPDLVIEMKKCLNFPRDFLRTVVELTLQLTYNNPTNRHFPKAASILIGDDVDEYASLIKDDISILLLENLFPSKLPMFPPEQNETLISIKDRSLKELQNENPQLSSYEASCKVLSKLILSNQIEDLEKEITETITEEMVERSPSLPSLLLLPINSEIVKKMFTTQPVDDSNFIYNTTSSNFNLNLNSTSSLNLGTSINTTSSNFDSKLSLNSVDFDTKSSLVLTTPDKRLFTITVECEKSKIIPLLTYFSSSVANIRMFLDELISLIYNNLNTTSDAYSFTLETLGKVSSNLPDYVMSGLFHKSLSVAISSNNWIHKWWTLRMIGNINFMSLPSRISARAFDFIELAVISKSEKLKQTAKKVSVKLIDNVKHEEFKYFIDRFCRKFDLFDQTTFESRVSYLSFVFQHIPQNWTISFIHIATLLTEAIGLIKFSMNVMREIFIIVGVLSNNLDEPLVLLFAKQAQLIIDPSFREFCGEQIGIGRPPVFDREETATNPLVFQTNSNYSSNTLINNLYNSATNITISADNSINYIKNIGRSVLVTTFDTDLTSNPSLWHTDPLHYAEAAFDMLSKVQWSRFNLLFNDTIYFFNLAQRMIELFPDKSNALAASLIEAENISFYNVDVYIQKSIIISALHDTALFSFCKLISLVSERFSQPENSLKPDDNENNKCLFSLKSDKYNTSAIVSTLSLIFPIMKDVDFLNVLCVQSFMQLVNKDISEDICLKVTKPSQKHLIGSGNKNINDLNSTSSVNIDQDISIDPSLLYQVNDEDQIESQNDSQMKPTEFEPFNDDEANGSPLTKNFGFLNFCSSLSPFYYLHIDVPEEMFKQEIILSFAMYSTVKITEEEANNLIDVTITRGSPRILYHVLKYCERMKIKIDLTEKLSHPYFISKKVFLAVLPFLQVRKHPNNYINTVIGTDDIVSFVLNATTMLNRRAAIAIIKFDTQYFMEKFMKIEKIKYDQLYNLVLYASAVAFPANDFFSFAVKIMDKYSNSRKKKNISRRLLSVFIGSNKTNKEIVINANSLLSMDIISSSSSDIYKKFTASQIIEYYYEIATISKTTNCSDVIEILCHVLSKNTIYGSLLNMIISPQLTLESIQGMIQSPFASLQTLPFHFFDDKLKYDPNFSEMSPQIIDYLLQTTVIRTTSTSSIILSFLARFLRFKNLQRNQMKVAFYFMHRNVDISPQCSKLREVLLVYGSFLNWFFPKTQELKTVVDFADKLFDYAIVPSGSISILNQVSYIMHDPSHVAVVLTPYLKMKDSYSMCYVCENAATYLLKVKMNRIERHSQHISKESKADQSSEQQSQIQSQQKIKSSQVQSQQKLQKGQTQSQQKLQQTTQSQQKITKKQQSNIQLQQSQQNSQSQQSNLPLTETQEDLASSSMYDESIDQIDDAVHVVSIARSFYATFCAVAAVENIKPTMKHDLLKGLFPLIYDYSLKILDDKDVKIFAPVFALLDENSEIPKELVDYVDASRSIVQNRK